jgi:hypothetical protein
VMQLQQCSDNALMCAILIAQHSLQVPLDVHSCAAAANVLQLQWQHCICRARGLGQVYTSP